MNEYISALQQLAHAATVKSADQAGEARGIQKAGEVYLQMVMTGEDTKAAPVAAPETVKPQAQVKELPPPKPQKRQSRAEKAKVEQEILKGHVGAVMRENPDWITDKEIQSALGAKGIDASLTSISSTLRRATDDGDLVKSNGKYLRIEFFK